MSRREDNQALVNLAAIVALVCDPLFEKDVSRVLVRNRFTPGLKTHRGDDKNIPKSLKGSRTAYADPTGEHAVWSEEIDDKTGDDIAQVAKALQGIKNTIHSILALPDTDPKARAVRTMPECLACGDPCVDRVFGGMDEKCHRRYKRWRSTSKVADRATFIAQIKAEKIAQQKDLSTPSDQGKDVKAGTE